MLIVWGTKRIETKLGHVADFCPACRDVRAFQLKRVGMAGHVYYISFGKGRLAGHVIECGECGLKLATDPERYCAVEKRNSQDLSALVSGTFPGVRETYSNRLALEERIRRSPRSVDAETRAALLMEPFGLLNPNVEAQYAETRFDRQSGLGCLGTVILSIVFFIVLATNLEPKREGLLAAVAAIVVGGALLYTILQLALGPRRYLRRKIAPALSRSVEPLGPTQEELSACLEKCRSMGMKIGAKLKVADLWAALMERLHRAGS